VVRADLEFEDNPIKQADKAAFFAEKYGDKKGGGSEKLITNKFSLSRIEWLDNVFTKE